MSAAKMDLAEVAMRDSRQESCQLRAIERSQHSITQAARDTETGESFGSNQTTVAKRIRTARVAHHDEIASQRLPTTRQLVATTGDRTQ